MAKHIFVTGGVVSSLGKGLTSAALGAAKTLPPREVRRWSGDWVMIESLCA